MASLSQLRERLLELTMGATAHQHLGLPISHYQGLVRDRIFPDRKLRPVQNSALQVSADAHSVPMGAMSDARYACPARKLQIQ
jgi:hypothetical protein